MKNLFALSSYQFELPKELVAKYPCTPRDSSRLMIVNRSTGGISEVVFRELVELLHSGDSLVFNDTKVIPARLIGKRESGGEAELFLTRRVSNDIWEALVRPAKKLPEGASITFSPELACKILSTMPNGSRCVRFLYEGDFEKLLEKYGQIPLPHYIDRAVEPLLDSESYQTVFARYPGAVAAPTAGLHFTQAMLNGLEARNVKQTTLTLHVGVGTFRPVQTEDIRDHQMHTEQIQISAEASRFLSHRDSTKTQICVGTTTCRALEALVGSAGMIPAGEYETNIFIYPGYPFKYVRSLLTNFHLPGSSLLMLVCAFAGYELAMEAYSKAIKERFRFYSYGDAMLIL